MVSEFLTSKDGNKTCKINSIFLHSAYSPIKEAERFVENINCPFIPEIIFILEPGLSYCVPFLKSRFPDTKLCAVRLTDQFSSFDSLFDYTFYFNKFSSLQDFENSIFNQFGENILSFSFFQSWEPSTRIFPNKFMEIFQSFKNIIEKCHSILRTRSFFEKRWLLNTINFSKYLNKSGIISKPGSLPVLICASGPSINEIIPFLKECGDKKRNFIILAVSSAILPLISNNIIPDFCISTDGGFWAKKHLDILEKFPEIKVAIAVEGNCSKKILRNNNVIPLSYSDGIEKEIWKSSEIPSLQVLRCGTVSGTALDFAKKISNGNIYFSGLDLNLSKGFQHTQKNALEINSSNNDNLLYSKEKRTCGQGFSNQKNSLKIYENWFAALPDEKHRKIFRVINNPQNSLGNIKDISTKIFIEFIEHLSKNTKPFSNYPEISFSKINSKKTNEKVSQFIKENSLSNVWLSNIFVSEYLNYIHSNDENKKEVLLEKMNQENIKLLEKLCKPFTKN